MSGTARVIGGAAQIVINGVPQNLMTASYSVGVIARETKKGQSGVFGYSEMPTPPYITCTITDVYGLTVEAFNEMTNVNIQLSLDNGKVIDGAGMWTTEAQVVNTQEGTLELRFEGLMGSVVEN